MFSEWEHSLLILRGKPGNIHYSSSGESLGTFTTHPQGKAWGHSLLILRGKPGDIHYSSSEEKPGDIHYSSSEEKPGDIHYSSSGESLGAFTTHPQRKAWGHSLLILRGKPGDIHYSSSGESLGAFTTHPQGKAWGHSLLIRGTLLLLLTSMTLKRTKMAKVATSLIYMCSPPVNQERNISPKNTSMRGISA